jgi:Flp pilus assembly protein TadG
MAFFSKCKSWLYHQEGAVAVEFALVCIPFIYMTIAIIELSMFFAAANMLESGVNASARSIRTGQLQTDSPADEQQAFKTDLCNRLFALIDCSNIDLEAIHVANDDFGNANSYTPTYDANGRLISQGFDAGESNSVILIRVAYRYPLWTPLFASIFSTQTDHTIPLMTTVVIQNEPYSFNSGAS